MQAQNNYGGVERELSPVIAVVCSGRECVCICYVWEWEGLMANTESENLSFCPHAGMQKMASLMFESNCSSDIWLRRPRCQGCQTSSFMTYSLIPPTQLHPLHITSSSGSWLLPPASSWGSAIWELSYMSGPHVVGCSHISEQMLTHIISSRLNSFFYWMHYSTLEQS